MPYRLGEAGFRLDECHFTLSWRHGFARQGTYENLRYRRGAHAIVGHACADAGFGI